MLSNYWVDTLNMSDEEGAKACIDTIKELSKSIGIPSGLSELGVKVEDFDVLATNALNDACGLTNPFNFTNIMFVIFLSFCYIFNFFYNYFYIF